MMRWRLEGAASADVPPDMFIGLVMARTGRLPSEIAREDYIALMRAWQVLTLYDQMRAGAK